MNNIEDEIPDEIIEQAEEYWAQEQWREQIEEKKKDFDEIPINLILDTNWWIYLAQGENPEALKQIVEKLNNGEFKILTSETLISEWDRNLNATKEEAQKAILEQTITARKISQFLKGDEKNQFDGILQKYKTTESERLQLIEDNFKLIDEIIKSKSIIIPLTDNVKDLVIDFGLKKKAPFQSKNSMGDAIIFFSSIEYLENNTDCNLTDSIFISYNYQDFSTSKQEKDIIHPDLKPFLDKTKTLFERNIGKAMKLTEELQMSIDGYLDDKAESALEDDYIDYQIDMYIQNQIDIKRGK